MPPPSFVFGFVPDSQTTFNFPFKGALRLLAMKRNILFSVYDNKNSPQTAENPLGIILLQVGALLSLSLRFYCVITFALNVTPCSYPNKRAKLALTSLPRGAFSATSRKQTKGRQKYFNGGGGANARLKGIY